MENTKVEVNVMNFDFLLKMLKNPEIYKFMLVGLINAVLLLLLTIIFTAVFEIFYLISAIISYEITIILGFFIHEHWTFAQMPKIKKTYLRLSKYNAFYLIGLAFNAVMLFFLTELLYLHYAISQSIAIVIVFIYNFITSKKITFRN